MTGGRPERGALVIVGVGFQLGRHVTRRALSEIRLADTVFALVDAFALAWLRELRPDLITLHGYYAAGKDRRTTYREMVERVLEPVRAGRRVCAVLYGHPGVFADVPHRALRAARAEGHEARMEPGLSADACLYADLGIDPGATGVQSFEATQFLAYRRVVDPSALLILWQVAVAGDLTCRRFASNAAHLTVLVSKLRRVYGADPEIILYEAARLPIEEPRAQRLALGDLPQARLEEHTTLVIPPSRPLEPDRATLAALGNGPGEPPSGP